MSKSSSIVLVAIFLFFKSSYAQWPTLNPNHPLLQGLFYGLAPGLGSQYVPGGKWRPGMMRPFTTKAHTFPLGDKKKEQMNGMMAAASHQRSMYQPMMHPQQYQAMMYGGGGHQRSYNPMMMYQQMMYNPMYAAMASSFVPTYAPNPMYGHSFYGPSAFGPSSFGGGQSFAPSGSFGGGNSFGNQFGSSFGSESNFEQADENPFLSSAASSSFADDVGGHVGIEEQVASYESPLTTIHEEDHSSLLSSALASPEDHATAETMTKKFKSKSGFTFGSHSSAGTGFSKPLKTFNSEESFLNSKFSPSDLYKRLDKLT